LNISLLRVVGVAVAIWLAVAEQADLELVLVFP
jgi:hypothetical protein